MKRYLVLLLLVASVAYGATTYTTNYQLAKPGDGDQNYGALLRGDLDTIDSQLKINADSTANHIADTVDAHDASAISSVVGTYICPTADTVQEFLTCLDGVYDPSLTGVVLTTGNQTISGTKDFSDAPKFSGVPNTLIRTNASGTVTATTFTAESPLTTKGDILAHDGTETVRLGVGTDGQVLIADSGEDSGMIWGGVSLTTGVTGVLPTANGGTGQNSTAVFPLSGTLVTRTAAETLSNKSLDTTNGVTLLDNNFELRDDGDPTKSAKFQNSGITTGTTRTFTFPDANTTLVGVDTTQTFTNKTFDANGTGNSITNIENADIAAGAAIDGTKIVSATTSVSGVVDTTAQSFSGLKTFTNSITVGEDAAASARTIDVRSGTSQRSELNFYQNGTAKTTIATANASNDLTSGTTVGDTVIRSQNSSDIFFTADGGATTHARMNTDGSQSYGATDAKVLVGGYFFGSAAIAAGGDCTGTPCTISANYGGMVSTVTRSATGTYTVNFTGSFWSSGPACVANSTRGGSIFCVINASGLSTSSYGISCYNDAGTLSDSRFSIMCHGPRT